MFSPNLTAALPDESSTAVPSLPTENVFVSDVDEAPSPIIEAYESLCPGAFDDGSELDEEPIFKPPLAKKRRKKGGSNFWRRKGARKEKYVPVSPGSRKRRGPMKRNIFNYNKTKWAHFDPSIIPQQKMREMISLFYLSVLKAPPPEDWNGEGGAISEICSALNLTNVSQRQRVRNIIADSHSALIAGVEYDSSRAYRPGTRAIEDGSVEQKTLAARGRSRQ